GLSIFFGRKKNEELTLEEELSGTYVRKTQFGQICDTLGVDLIHARSSQAKGRVSGVVLPPLLHEVIWSACIPSSPPSSGSYV
ncbi:MAG: hypothetical protein LBQ33_00570, partial [Oscillospiraceae bacterium]|nr:hypothetical protein [Oscillospiraceae bacterium]